MLRNSSAATTESFTGWLSAARYLPSYVRSPRPTNVLQLCKRSSAGLYSGEPSEQSNERMTTSQCEERVPRQDAAPKRRRVSEITGATGYTPRPDVLRGKPNHWLCLALPFLASTLVAFCIPPACS